MNCIRDICLSILLVSEIHESLSPGNNISTNIPIKIHVKTLENASLLKDLNKFTIFCQSFIPIT